jgi:protocatechuate 3,4-dioxygenase beta subunit
MQRNVGSKIAFACFIAFVSLLMLFGLTANTCAQSAALSGTVLDKSGRSIAGAQVTLINEATAAGRSGNSDADGKFVFSQLLPGKYRLEVGPRGSRRPFWIAWKYW